VSTISKHTAAATVALPAVLVPAYELTPGYTTQYPGGVIRVDDFAVNDGGWVAGDSNSRVVRATVPALSRTGLIVQRLNTSGTAKASRVFTGLLVGRKYMIVMRAVLPDPASGRTMALPNTSGVVAGESGAGLGPDGFIAYATVFIATATTQTVELIVNGVPAGGAGVYTDGMYVRDVTVTLRATSVYTPPVMQPATTVPAATVPLAIKQASVTMDDSWSPYVQATLVCSAPSIETLEALDPRDGLRVNLTLTQAWGDGGVNWNIFGYRAPVTRTFNLSLRDRTVDKRTGEMTLELASDEALIQDYSLVATAPDTTPLAYQASLRAIVNYVLGKVGASLTAGIDTDVTVSQSPNLIPDPRFVTASNWNTRGFGTGGAGTQAGEAAGWNVASRAFRKTWTAAASNGATSGLQVAGIPVTAGKTYTLQGSLLASVAGKVANTVIVWTDSVGAYITQTTGPNVTMTSAGVAYPLTVTGVAPAGAVAARLVFDIVSTSGWAVGNYLSLGLPMFAEGPISTPYFDGQFPGNSIYTYSWQGTAYASPSVRTLVVPRSEQLLDWMPGVSGWEFLASIVQATGYRLWCDEARVWHLAREWNTQTQINVSPTTGLTAGRDQISREEAWYDSVVIEYRWTDRGGAQQTRWDIAGVPGNSTLTLVYNDTPYPGPGAAASVLYRADGKGRIISPEAINNYRATPGMVLQVSLPDAPVQTGMLSNVTWELPGNVMQIGSRGLTDTPANAWINAVGNWSAATGTWAAATGTN